MPPS
jgi:hypothetical protein